MMQTNPKEVMERYKNNAEFTQLMVEFSQVMGSHFTKLGQKEQQAQKKEEVVAPPLDKEVEVRIRFCIDNELISLLKEILKDPKVKSLLTYLQKNERVDFHRLFTA